MKHALTKFEVIHIIKYILKGENNETIKRRYKTTIPSVYICFVIMCPQSLYLPQLWIEWSTTSLTAYNMSCFFSGCCCFFCESHTMTLFVNLMPFLVRTHACPLLPIDLCEQVYWMFSHVN